MEGQRRSPYVHEAPRHFGTKSLQPELPRVGQTHETVVAINGLIYDVIETRAVNVGTSIEYLGGVNQHLADADDPTRYTSIHLTDDSERVYLVEKDQTTHTWTIKQEDDSHVYKLNIDKTSAFIVGHPATFVHAGVQQATSFTGKIKKIIVVDTHEGRPMPRLGTGEIENDDELKRRIHALSGKATHVERTIMLFDKETETGYVAGYYQHERDEGYHMHSMPNVLTILEGYFEIRLFNREIWDWEEPIEYGPGNTIRIDPYTPHLVAPARQPLHPHRLNIIKITTRAHADIRPGERYNIPITDLDIPRPDDRHPRRRIA